MSKIKGVNTSPELILRKSLWSLGIRYRINVAKLLGKPDIVLSKSKLIIFIDSEFFHGYKWDEKKPKIKTNREYWIPKIERNMARDKQVNEHLQAQGWTVLRFWSNDVKKNLDGCVSIIKEAIDSKS
jgi:DNA mismatch endonuclease (patch repair protein)